jgi:hypothetical protein
MFCEVCGAELPDNVSVCTFCGSPVKPQDQSESVATQARDSYSHASGSYAGGEGDAYATYDASNVPQVSGSGDYATGGGYQYQDGGNYIDSQQPYDYMAADGQNLGYQQPYDYMVSDSQGVSDQQPYDYQLSSDGNYIDYGSQPAGGYQDYGYVDGNGAGYDGYADDNASYGTYYDWCRYLDSSCLFL